MARLLEWIESVGAEEFEVIDDPNVRNSGATTASDGAEQTFEGIGQRWAFRLAVPFTREREARRLRGALGGLMGGANAMRMSVYDPEVMRPAEAGLNVSPDLTWRSRIETPWSNGLGWSNGRKWKVSYPKVKVAASAARGATEVRLQEEFWGHELGVGDRFGFFPFHFGMYEVTQVIEPGRYRVRWALRAAITYSASADEVTYATLFPRIVVRPIGRAGAAMGASRQAYTDGTELRVVEVFDAHVRTYFTD